MESILMYQRNRGFSLVEILVAMTLLLVVLSLGSMAYGQFRSYWTEKLGDFDQHFDEAKALSQLLYAIENVQPYIIKDAEENAFHYFEGAQTVLRSVISSSFREESRFAAFEIYVDVNQRQESQLFYREQLFKASPLVFEDDIGQYGEPMLLLKGFEQFKFEFLGIRHVNEWFKAVDSPMGPQETWYGAYSGKDTKILPTVVKVSFVKDEQFSELLIPIRHFSPEQHEFYNNEPE